MLRNIYQFIFVRRGRNDSCFSSTSISCSFLSMLILGTGIKAVGDTISWSVFNSVGFDNGAEGDKNGADEVDGIGTIPWTRFTHWESTTC